MNKNVQISGYVHVLPPPRAPIGASILGAFFALVSPQVALAQVEGEGAEEPAEAADPFIGVFSGFVSGDNGTTGDIRVEIAADPTDADALLASVSIGEGLEADLGRLCGTHDVPALEKMVSFTHDGEDTVFGQTTWPLGRITLAVDITATILEDGEAITAVIAVDTPAFCPNVEMVAEMTREVATTTTATAASPVN